jgi:hypothetical protein
MQDWAAIIPDVAQKLIDSRPGQIAEVLNTAILTLHQLHVIINKAFDTYEMIVIILQYSIVTSDKNI